VGTKVGRAGALTAALLALSAGWAWGQPADLKNTPPVAPPSAPELPAKEKDQPAGQAPAVAEQPGQPMPQFAVSRFVIKYRDVYEGVPTLEELAEAPVYLTEVDGAWAAGERGGAGVTTARVGDDFGAMGKKFTPSGVQSVSSAIARALQRNGLLGVYVLPAETEFSDDGTLTDLREGRTTIVLEVWLGKVRGVGSLATGDRIDAADRINADQHQRIRENSPVQAGGVLRGDLIDDYVFRLNRHPGRKVDVSVAPEGEPGEVKLDYIVGENKPWNLYYQVSNTGTKSTTEWRQRFGFAHYQLTGNDDIFRFDYLTAGFDKANAIQTSYDFPLADWLRLKPYYQWSEYDATIPGAFTQRFKGRNWQVGFETELNVLQVREFFADVVGGMKWDDVKQESLLTRIKGNETFYTPYVGLKLERFTDASSTVASGIVEFGGGGRKTEVDKLGRFQASTSWTTFKYSFSHDFYLEPLLGLGDTLAHEIGVALRGQYTGSNKRLVPNFQEPIGGFFTVRGYKENVAAGDSTLVANFEYRFHLPRALPVQGDPDTFMGKPFRWQPQQPFGRTDWDLIFRGFFDMGFTKQNKPFVFERNENLASAGFGMEFQLRQNISLRADWGFALRKAIGSTPEDATKKGDNRVHFVATLIF
jgi:hemolysin activation/secretion protein